MGAISRLPVSIRLVLESVLRNCDGIKVPEESVRQLAQWQAKGERTSEIPFVVARIVLQDFTGVPLLVDLAAVRSAVHRLGKNPKMIEPLVPSCRGNFSKIVQSSFRCFVEFCYRILSY